MVRVSHSASDGACIQQSALSQAAWPHCLREHELKFETRAICARLGVTSESCRGVSLDGPIAGPLRQVLVHDPTDAVGPSETKHTDTRGLWICLADGAKPLNRCRCWRVVQIQAQQVDRRDE